MDVLTLLVTLAGWLVVSLQQREVLRLQKIINTTVEKEKIKLPRKLSQVDEIMKWTNDGYVLYMDRYSVLSFQKLAQADKSIPEEASMAFAKKKIRRLV
jgi:hypothetical protein